MKANSVGYSAIRKAPDALPSFGIPEFNVAVVWARQETVSIMIEAYITYTFVMSLIGPEHCSLSVYIPELYKAELVH